MKEKLPIVIVALIIVGYYGLSAWSDYTWENRYLAERNRDWIVFKL